MRAFALPLSCLLLALPQYAVSQEGIAMESTGAIVAESASGTVSDIDFRSPGAIYFPVEFNATIQPPPAAEGEEPEPPQFAMVAKQFTVAPFGDIFQAATEFAQANSLTEEAVTQIFNRAIQLGRTFVSNIEMTFNVTLNDNVVTFVVLKQERSEVAVRRFMAENGIRGVDSDLDARQLLNAVRVLRERATDNLPAANRATIASFRLTIDDIDSRIRVLEGELPEEAAVGFMMRQGINLQYAQYMAVLSRVREQYERNVNKAPLTDADIRRQELEDPRQIDQEFTIRNSTFSLRFSEEARNAANALSVASLVVDRFGWTENATTLRDELATRIRQIATLSFSSRVLVSNPITDISTNILFGNLSMPITVSQRQTFEEVAINFCAENTVELVKERRRGVGTRPISHEGGNTHE